MASRGSAISTVAPFLYPSFCSSRCVKFRCRSFLNPKPRISRYSSSSRPSTVNDLPESHLNPLPDDYTAPSFADKAELTINAGPGGNGCISFLREAYQPDGPPNGGDGGAGGNVYIQAAHGETSLHKLARRRFIRAGRGKHGQGSAKGGARGDDIIITVPVGTIVRELERQDPAEEEAANFRVWRKWKKEMRRKELEREEEERARKKLMADKPSEQDPDEEMAQSTWTQTDEAQEDEVEDPQRHKWLLYPGMSKSDVRKAHFPPLPRRTRLLQQPPAPIYLDLSRPTPTPILLAAGGIGGLGNPHFNSREHPRPLFATKGEDAVSMRISLELKLLADVGLVGLPNAGKSTLLRAITNSRTRVGAWAFTTLQPNIGTVVLDKYSGRPVVGPRARPSAGSSTEPGQEPVDPRTRFTIADIPGLIEGAHLDRGLGIAFLRHVERAGVLAFVVDLSAGNAVRALEALWREVGLYAQMRDDEERDREAQARINWDSPPDPLQGTVNLMDADVIGPPAKGQGESPVLHIAGKPWFVVATKADLPDTQANFAELKAYLDRVTSGAMPHPSGVEGAWTKHCAAIPVSAIHKQGVDRIVHWTVGLLEESLAGNR
ncbi:hypothetical protein HIM_01390 [Hirsutella minnesotensis 3608]|nr:hypothetical protein HIM_01390 [Hirsutella minnesotensis 3608]